jgi:hypothetical protein
VFERHQDAKITGGRVDRADKGHNCDCGDVLEVGKRQSRERHERCAAQQKRTQIVTRRDPANRQCENGRSKQRTGQDNTDLDGVVADRV